MKRGGNKLLFGVNLSSCWQLRSEKSILDLISLHLQASSSSAAIINNPLVFIYSLKTNDCQSEAKRVVAAVGFEPTPPKRLVP